jgi:iron complex transport system substrate-binding protein
MPMRVGLAATVGFILAAAAFAAAGREVVGPQRIVSMNLCADELVLRLGAPGTVRSVTWLARDPSISAVAAQARHVPVNRGLAEEIVPLQPDLVVVGIYTTRTTVALLKRLNVPVLELDVPNTLPDAMRQILQVAEALGRSERGAALVAEMEAAIARVQAEQRQAVQALPMQRTRPVAAVYNPNGFTVGAGSLVHDLMTRAGLRNLAAERRIDNYGRLPLDLLLMAQPDLLIMNSIADRPPALAYEVLQHPALRQQFKPAQVVTMPPAWWTCAGPQLVDALALLARAARAREDATVAGPARFAGGGDSSAQAEPRAPGRPAALAADLPTR